MKSSSSASDTKKMLSADRIEEIKENIETHTKGYKTSSLQSLVSGKSPAERERERRLLYEPLMSKNDQSKQDNTSDDADELGPFIHYLDWSREHFPSGHSSITKVTEEAIRRFRKNDKYKNDSRYVELWMALGKKQQDAGDLFKYLVVNGIGSECALFYEEYAGYKESMSCIEQADEIYRKGIQEKACPLSRLVRQYNAFLLRVEESGGLKSAVRGSSSSRTSVKSILKEKDLPEFNEDDNEEDEEVGGRRRTTHRRFSIALPSLAKKTSSTTTKTSSKVSSKLKVFQDSVADEPSQAELLFPSGASKATVVAAKYDLKPVPKENARDAEKWSGSVLPQQHSAKPASSSAKMNVFRDEDEEAISVQENRSKRVKKSLLQPLTKTAVESHFASLLTDEDKSQPGPISAGSRLVANVELCYVNRNEYSFEETRAELCHKHEMAASFYLAEANASNSLRGPDNDLPSGTPMKHQPQSIILSASQAAEAPSPWHASGARAATESSTAFVISSPGKEKGPIQDIFKMFEEEKKDVDDDDDDDIGEPPVMSFALSSPPKKVSAERKARPPSPTIHTKEAMSAISAMFSNPVPSSREEEEDVFGNLEHHRHRPLEITTTADAIIYNPEDDETISRQVYKRPESSTGPLKIGVFRDQESDEDEDENGISSAAAIQTPFQCRPVTNLFGHPVHVMTPVTECSEKTHSYTSHSISTGPFEVFSRPPIILEEGEEEEKTENTMQYLNSKPLPIAVLENVPEEVVVSGEDDDLEEADSYEEPSVTLPSPCNPTLVRQAILSKTRPPSECKLYVFASQESSLGSDLSKQGSSASVERHATFSFSSSQDKFNLVEKLGSSNYYRIERETEAKSSVIRLQDPPSVWEFYMLYSLHSKIPSSFKNSIVKPLSCYLFKNESFTELEHIEGGSLLEAIGQLNYRGPGIPEIVAAFWALKVLTILEGLHSRRIIHGDIQINNFMIRGKGENPRKKFDLVLNDFSASIDMTDCPESQTFQIESTSLTPAEDELIMDSDELASSECWEFRHNCEWTFEPDWFGAAGVLHTLIFGEPLSITESSTGIFSHSASQKPFIDIRNSLPVHWNGEMWVHAFTTLLNLSHKDLEAGVNPLESLKSEFRVFISKHDHLLDDAFSKCMFS